MKRSRMVAALVSAFVLSAAAAMAGGGMQVDINALYANPTGSLGRDIGVDFKDSFDGAFGFGGDVLFGVSNGISLGVGAGWWKNHETQVLADLGVDLALTSIPLHGIVLWKTTGSGPVGFWLRGGAGITSHKIDDGISNDSQSSFSWDVGAGLALRVSDTWDVTGGVSYTQASTGDGDVWNDGANPKFLLFSLGLRYGAKSSD